MTEWPAALLSEIEGRYEASGAVAIRPFELMGLFVGARAKKLVNVFGSVKQVLEADMNVLLEFGGLTKKQALRVKAIGDLMKISREEEFKRGRVIGTPDDVASFVKEQIGSKSREVFACFFVDHRNHLMAFEVLQEGTVDHTAVYPREILKRALDLNATGMILCHNHPAGSLEPSEGDKQLTRQVMTAARAIGITVHDHIIATAESYFSFRQAGLLI